MANISILAAFERMWYHVVTKLGEKADLEHNHDISNVDNLQNVLDTKVPITRTINGKNLSNNITLTASDIEGLTNFTETDPTVPAWAKAATKPTYTASEVGAASTSHTHTVEDILDTLPVTKGGTGYTSITDTTYTTARYRASSLHSSETNPSINGVITWIYK